MIIRRLRCTRVLVVHSLPLCYGLHLARRSIFAKAADHSTLTTEGLQTSRLPYQRHPCNPWSQKLLRFPRLALLPNRHPAEGGIAVFFESGI